MKRVVIVGAGVVGLVCALRLAKAGARVTLLEAESDDLNVFRPTASVAAAGMLAPFDSQGSRHDHLSLASFDLWRELGQRAGLADSIRFDGGVTVATSEADAAALQARVMNCGRKAQALAGDSAARRVGLRGRVAGAVLIEDEGVVDPLRAMSGLVFEARQHGVVIANNQDARHVDAHTVLTHEGETYEADAVVLAPGAWATDALMQSAPALRHVRPAKGHIAAVTLERTLRANLHAPGFYLARRREDVVIGASMEFGVYMRNVVPAEVDKLFAAAEAVLPGQVRPAGPAWAGIRPMSPDGWPIIGPTGAGLFVAAGHSRNGWLLAPITAEIITAYVFGEEIKPEWAALSPARFEKHA